MKYLHLILPTLFVGLSNQARFAAHRYYELCPVPKQENKTELDRKLFNYLDNQGRYYIQHGYEPLGLMRFDPFDYEDGILIWLPERAYNGSIEICNTLIDRLALYDIDYAALSIEDGQVAIGLTWKFVFAYGWFDIEYWSCVDNNVHHWIWGELGDNCFFWVRILMFMDFNLDEPIPVVENIRLQSDIGDLEMQFFGMWDDEDWLGDPLDFIATFFAHTYYNEAKNVELSLAPAMKDYLNRKLHELPVFVDIINNFIDNL